MKERNEKMKVLDEGVELDDILDAYQGCCWGSLIVFL